MEQFLADVGTFLLTGTVALCLCLLVDLVCDLLAGEPGEEAEI